MPSTGLIIFSLIIVAVFVSVVYYAKGSGERSKSNTEKSNREDQSPTPDANVVVSTMIDEKESEEEAKRQDFVARYEAWVEEYTDRCMKKCEEAKNTLAEYRFVKSPQDHRYTVEHLNGVEPFIEKRHLLCGHCKHSKDWCLLNCYGHISVHPRYPTNENELENIKAGYINDNPTIIYRPFGPIPVSFSTAEEASEALTRYLSTGDHSDIVEYRPNQG